MLSKFQLLLEIVKLSATNVLAVAGIYNTMCCKMSKPLLEIVKLCAPKFPAMAGNVIPYATKFPAVPRNRKTVCS